MDGGAGGGGRGRTKNENPLQLISVWKKKCFTWMRENRAILVLCFSMFLCGYNKKWARKRSNNDCFQPETYNFWSKCFVIESIIIGRLTRHLCYDCIPWSISIEWPCQHRTEQITWKRLDPNRKPLSWESSELFRMFFSPFFHSYLIIGFCLQGGDGDG